MAGVLSVSRVNHYISGLLDQDYALSRLQVQGEVSNCKYHSSGHIYFTLKDETSSLAAIMFSGARSGLTFRLEDGMQVVVTGKIQVYEKTGSYQLYAKSIQIAGVGDWARKFAQIKAELEEMGMFDPIYKQPIPDYIKRLGIVTAPTGAAVRDIIQITKRRNPFVQILLFPALVQGEGAAESICDGIRTLDGKVDCIIVGRGGGSAEDLWAFNEPEVARTIFDCSTPVISAVGHETDFTIADFVADLRAPTPSAAAELAVYDVHLLQDELNHFKDLLNGRMSMLTELYRARIEKQRSALRLLHPASKLFSAKQNLADVSMRMDQRMEDLLSKRKHRLELLAGRMDAGSPLRKLSGGFSYLQKEEGNPVRSVSQVKKSDLLSITVTDGTIRAVVKETKEYTHGKSNVD